MMNEECPQKIPEDFPDTVSKVQELCSIITEDLSCNVRVREECDPLGNTTTLVREIYEYIQSICDENSSTYKVVSKNIRCLASSLEQIGDFCYGIRTESGNLHFFRENAEAHVGDIESLAVRDLVCLETLMTITCGSLMAGTMCGDEVEDVIFDVTDNLIGRVKPCSPEVSALRGTLRTAFRDAFKAEETFVNNIGSTVGAVAVEDAVEQEST